MATKMRDDDWAEPQRDAHGRFRKGFSGNPPGRPPKPIEQQWTLVRSIAEALDEEISVTEGSNSRRLKMRDVVVKTLIRNLAKAKPRDAFYILSQLESLGALGPPAAEEKEIFTEEDRLLFATVRSELSRLHCSNCEQPMSDEPTEDGEREPPDHMV